MATHSSVLAWRIPGTEDPGGLLSHGISESDVTEPVVQIFPFAPKLQCGSLQHYYSSCFYLKFWYLVRHGFFWH